jgi:hypothetical protein
MRFLVLISALILISVGCQAKTGNSVWNLKLGGEARLVSADGSDISLDGLGPPVKGKADRRSPKMRTPEQITLPAGTAVVVHAIDGDDARVEIKDGARAGSFYWVPCSRLEPVAP